MKIAQGGALEARRIAGGVVFYWRHTEAGKTDRLPIGAYDPAAPPKSLAPTTLGYSVEAARRKAEKLAQEHSAALDSGLGGYRASKAAKFAAAQRSAAEAEAMQGRTLQRLLEDYCDHLEALGRRSHVDARSIFRLHVLKAWPALATLPARDITSDNVIAMLRRLHKSGHGRTSNKLRAYLMAAYQVATGARSLASIPEHFKAYHVEINPVQSTRPDTASNKADKNPLSADEMRRYWKIIKDLVGIRGVSLRLHLLTGGQRIDQLVKVKKATLRDGCITLLDAKGRPGKAAREHTVPLLGQVLTDVGFPRFHGHTVKLA